PLYGNSACGVSWTPYALTAGNEDLIEILVHNPHRYGNANAVDELLSSMAFWSGIDFEKTIMDRDQPQRNTGLLFVIVALLLLGSALFSSLLHVRNYYVIWQIGIAILMAGVYMIYCGRAVPFWNEIIALNTSVLGVSMMFYLYFLSEVAAGILRRGKESGRRAMMVLRWAIGLFLLLPIVTDIYFYDTWMPWIVVQSGVNLVLLVWLAREYAENTRKSRLGMISISLPLIAFEVDAFGTAMGWWAGGLMSKYVYIVLFIAALIVVLRIIPEGVNAATKARELEIEKNMALAELKESRVAIMLSQIKPHFIYNTLGTIERMCLKDPQKAFELVRNFSLYLRGNFSELDSVAPIRFSEELKHVEYYVNIEKVRFPDMTIQYEVEATEFVLPALSVQPLVENAIKHGLMRLESGGTVVIHSYETPTHFCVEVRDDGAGFDVDAPVESKKHVGLRNIRSRLKDMVDGELLLESTPGVGTKALIMIPKEANV
ncbi:MAG: histidine kinase, partial [Clostridia bacterium]|nr:histidine kinase [Clostridia bacterium]